MGKPRTHYSTHYQLLQIMPAGDVCGVWCCNDDEGYYLFVDTLDFLGVAEGEDRTYEVSGSTSRMVHEEKPHGEVVGVFLSEGGAFHISQEDDNFAGFVRRGEDPRESLDFLQWDYRQHVNDNPRVVVADSLKPFFPEVFE